MESFFWATVHVAQKFFTFYRSQEIEMGNHQQPKSGDSTDLDKLLLGFLHFLLLEPGEVAISIHTASRMQLSKGALHEFESPLGVDISKQHTIGK